MNNYRIKELSTIAYELFSSDSSEDKAFQFAAFVAYDELSKQEEFGDDEMACVASEALLEHAKQGHRYAAELALKNISLKKSMDEKSRAQMPWEQKKQGERRFERQEETSFFTILTKLASEKSSAQELDHAFKKKYPRYTDMGPMKELYAKTFSAAYLAFLRASKSEYLTSSQVNFEGSIERDLTFNLIDIRSYSEFMSCVLQSNEMIIAMALLIVLGLLVLALPSLGVTAMAPTTFYATGGVLALAGSSFFLWQACSASPEENVSEVPENTNTSYLWGAQ